MTNTTPDKGKFQTPTKGYKGELKRTITPIKSNSFINSYYRLYYYYIIAVDEQITFPLIIE